MIWCLYRAVQHIKKNVFTVFFIYRVLVPKILSSACHYQCKCNGRTKPKHACYCWKPYPLFLLGQFWREARCKGLRMAIIQNATCLSFCSSSVILLCKEEKWNLAGRCYSCWEHTLVPHTPLQWEGDASLWLLVLTVWFPWEHHNYLISFSREFWKSVMQRRTLRLRNLKQIITSSGIARVMEVREPNQILTLWFPFLDTGLFFDIFCLNLMVVITVGL